MQSPMSDTKHFTIKIPIDYAELRIDQALAQLLPDYSRTVIKNWIVAGKVLLNGNKTKSKVKVQGGDVIELEIEEKVQTHWLPQAIKLDILFEDEEILVLNKPTGLVVHPGAGNPDQTMLNALLHHSPQLANLPRAGIIHRLDKNTSGLLVVAKTAKALKSLSHQLKKHHIEREYQAVVYGEMISGGKIDLPIGRHPHERTHMTVTENGKPAITHFRIMEKYPHFTRLLVKLQTGRTHQIRVHMSHIKHPIVGDVTYGGRVRLSKGMNDNLIKMLRSFKRQALHAYALTFAHPVTQEIMRFECPLPEDMNELINVLRMS